MGVEQYVGRTVDILAYQGGAVSGGEVLLSQSLANQHNSGQITTGIQKLAQRFLLELLTEKGSMVYEEARGCAFMEDARLGRLQTALDVLSSFSAALVDIQHNLILEERESDPLDERFSSAEILNISFSRNSASILVRVISEAGTSRKVIAPLTITI